MMWKYSSSTCCLILRDDTNKHRVLEQSCSVSNVKVNCLCCSVFLIRESQQHAQCFVLSLCFKLKTKHYLVIPVSPTPPRSFCQERALRPAALTVSLSRLRSARREAGSTSPWTTAWRSSSTSCSWWSSTRSTRASSPCAWSTPASVWLCDPRVETARCEGVWRQMFFFFLIVWAPDSSRFFAFN